MAFQTIRSASGVDFIGTDEADVLVAFNEELPIYVGGRKGNDSVTLVQAVTAITRAATVQGGEGSDTLGSIAATANSTINGNKGDDLINFKGIITTSLIAGGAGNDTFTSPGNFVASTLNGNDGNDTIGFGSSANTSLVAGGKDNDTINLFLGGNTYNDVTVNGNDGLDTINVTGTTASPVGNFTVFGGAGADTISFVGAVNGNAGNVGFTISGDKGNDFITGSNQVDTVLGGEGNDTVAGSLGNDEVTGGLGSDTYQATAGSNDYNITAIADSAAATSGTATTFDVFSAGGAFVSGADQLDISKVASTLAGGVIAAGTSRTFNGADLLGGAFFADLGAVKAALDALGVAGSNTSTVGGQGIQVFQFTAAVGVGAPVSSYTWINDSQSAFNAGDLLFQTAALNQILATDLIIA